jgi:fibronectin type 3 domain-containing protein
MEMFGEPVKKLTSMFAIERELDYITDLALDESVPDDNPAKTQATKELSSLALEAKEKRDAVAYKIKKFEAEAVNMERFAEEFAERSKAYRKKAEKLREMVLRSMKVSGVKRLAGDAFEYSVAKNPSRVEVVNQDMIPEQLLRKKLTVEPDKTMIRKAIESGVEVLGAKLVDGEDRVSIKLL